MLIGGTIMSKITKNLIYSAYKKFYDREPNLSKENLTNLTVEIQAMAYLLHEYGVSFGDYGFCYEYVDLKMPMSIGIQDIIIEELIGNIDVLSDTSIEFNKRSEELITIIGSAIRNILANSQNKIEKLRRISNILYIKNHVRPLANDQEIMETEKCAEEDLREVDYLLEIIKQERCKDNFDKSNIENVSKMIDEEEPSSYGMLLNESGSGKSLRISEESRKKLAKSFINRD